MQIRNSIFGLYCWLLLCPILGQNQEKSKCLEKPKFHETMCKYVENLDRNVSKEWVKAGAKNDAKISFDTVRWTITCFTNDNKIADSRANQHIILNGLQRSSQQISFDWKKSRFQHRSIDIFNVKTKRLGPLQNVTLWNDNARKGPIWVVANITLKNLNDGSTYVTTNGVVFINRTRKITLVKNIFSPTTKTPSDESSTYSSKSYSGETESQTFLDTASTETTIQTTALIYEESTIRTDATINSIITTDATINNTTATSYITSPTNTTNSTMTSSTLAPMCLCPCRKKLSEKEQIEHLKELKKELTIDKKNTSRYIRKKISVTDNRVSARATGYVGIVLLIFPFATILLADLSTLVTYLRAKYRKSDDNPL